MPLRADLHIHTSFSGDCDTPPEKLVRRCMDVGLDCIAVTDHNSIEGALEVRRLGSEMAPGLLVIIGEEVKSTQGDIIGLFLEEEIPKGLPPGETVRRIRDQGGLVSVPHPYDSIRRGPLSNSALQEILPQVDFLEALNARTILSRDVDRCRRLAAETSLTPLAVSDAHILWELGSAYTELGAFDATPESFRGAAQGGRTAGGRSTPLVHLVTAYVKLKKRLF